MFAHLASNITVGALVKSPMKNWNKAKDILKDHQKREYHITTSLRADDFLRSAERPETHSNFQGVVLTPKMELKF